MDGYYGKYRVGLDDFYAIGSDVLFVFGIGEYPVDRQSFMYLSYADGSFERLPETLIPDCYDGTNFLPKNPERSNDFYLYKQGINARTSTALFPLSAPFDNWYDAGIFQHIL